MQARQPVFSGQGVGVLQTELDDYIARVTQEDFDTLVENLNQHEDVLIKDYTGGLQSEWAFHRCLDNRRLAKIYVELASRPPAEADRLTKEIFAAKFQKYRSDFLAGLDGPPPVGTNNVSDNLKAVYSAVFLSAIFCPVSEVLRQFKEWEAYGQSLDPRAEGIDDPKEKLLTRIMLDHYGYPESLFKLNIYAWMLRDRCGDTDFEELLPKSLPTLTAAFGAWDEKPKLYPVRHPDKVEPAVARAHVKEFAFHPGWDSAANALERNRKIFQQLRQRLEACAARETD